MSHAKIKLYFQSIYLSLKPIFQILV